MFVSLGPKHERVLARPSWNLFVNFLRPLLLEIQERKSAKKCRQTFSSFFVCVGESFPLSFTLGDYVHNISVVTHRLALFRSLCNKRQLSRKNKFDKLSGMFPALVFVAF